MLRNTLRTALSLTVLTTLAGLALAQAQVQTTTNQPTLRAKSIMGAQVSLQGGTGVGTVEDIILNTDGVVDYLIVSEGGKLVTVPWEAAKFNYEKRTAVINISPEQFRQIPTFSVDRYPEFYSPAYRVQVYRHYGLTPGRERRLERREERRP
jgi:sporulation protein YlmC with PRC-barrel domain